MTKLKVALLFGGKSGEHEVSIVSAMSVYQALNPALYDITLIGIDPNGRWTHVAPTHLLAHKPNPRLLTLSNVANTIAMLPFPHTSSCVPVQHAEDMASLFNTHFDVVLPILHGPNGEDGTVQGLLELAQVAYVGSGVLGSAVCMDKATSKVLLQHAGLPVVPYMVGTLHTWKNQPHTLLEKAERMFGYPYFVKPSNMGSSVGVHKVKNKQEAHTLVADAFQYDTTVLFEQSIPARELECAVLGNNEPRASMVGEIEPHAEFYSYEAKYIDENGASLHIPANISEETSQHVQHMALEAFKTLRCRGMARVDFFLDKTNHQLYINELNTLPGFTPISMYPKLWEASGVAYPVLLNTLIQLALEQHHTQKQLKTAR